MLMIRSWLVSSLIILSFVLSSTLQATEKTDPFASLFGQQTQFLPVDDAFRFDFEQKNDVVYVRWTIADEYYLYADKFQFVGDGLTIVSHEKPSATQIEDEFFGVSDVYFFETEIAVKVADVGDNALLKVRYQGCAKAGLCYQPTVKEVPVDVITKIDVSAVEPSQADDIATSSIQNQLADKLNSESFFWVLVLFFGLGVGLAFTPCVFPMFPILSGIIAGQSNLTAKKGLWLSLVYVQGMALTYSLLGLVVASAGAQFQAALQHPAILATVSVIFIILAGAMFGWYNLQLPSSWTSKLTQVSNNQKSGNSLGVFVMGALSGLIASPCTTAPLTGALLYVAQTGDLFIGFITLYVLSLGMGLPLLLLGLSGGKLLPKAGNWMNLVKNTFGFILLFIPIILLERMVDSYWVFIATGVLVFALSAYIRNVYHQASGSASKASLWLVANLLFTSGLGLVAYPHLSFVTPAPVKQDEHEEIAFIKVVTIADIEREVAIAKANGQGVMLDLYADWCVACKEFEAFTFSDPEVQNKMNQLRLLQVDMTENSQEDINIMEKFQIFGLPTILLFNESGIELPNRRVTGFMDAEQFAQHLTVTFRL